MKSLTLRPHGTSLQYLAKLFLRKQPVYEIMDAGKRRQCNGEPLAIEANNLSARAEFGIIPTNESACCKQRRFRRLVKEP